MAETINYKTITKQIACLFSLLCFSLQVCLAAERWQIVILPDKHYSASIELPAIADLHNTISQGLTIALTNADFDVLSLQSLSLPNCILEDCSSLTDQSIQQAAKLYGKEVNLALLYQITSFKQRQITGEKWYFNLSGRLLDLQNGTQQDAFSVDNWVNHPAENCIGNCLDTWLNENLSLLAQDLGAVLSEKLAALPRHFHYLLHFDNFNSTELQAIDVYLKKIEGYVADTLLRDTKIREQALELKSTRTYKYISELSASELNVKLAELNQQESLPITLSYDSSQRLFSLTREAQADYWTDFSQLFDDIFRPSKHESSVTQSFPKSADKDTDQRQQEETEEEKQERKDHQMWQQALSVNTKESYQQYLTIWPQGLHFIQANAAVKTFQDDENAWQQAFTQNTRQGFQQYLRAHSTGMYREQAKQQLVLLHEQQQQRQKRRENRELANNYYYQQKNYSEALFYYQQAAKLGDALSQYQLGKMYEEGQGKKKNMYQAALWYVQAANQGHPEAQATLGYMYSKGHGVEQDYGQAIQWYQKAAEQGHMKAQYNLAYLYSLGQGTLKDYRQAAYWYEKSAIQGDADAQNDLGQLYERGLGVSKNLVKAKTLYQKAASQGHQIARINLQMLNN